MQRFILRHRQRSGACQITAVYTIHTHDVTDSTAALHLSLLLPLPTPATVTQTLQPASQMHQYFMCSRGWHRLPLWSSEVAEAKVLHKRGSIQARAGCSEGSGYRGGRHTEKHPLHKNPSEQERLWDADTFMFSTQRRICLHGSAFKISARIYSRQYNELLF